MRKALLLIVIVVGFLAVATAVHAGGCCYKSFSATNGIANSQNAIIDVAFVDPRPSSPGQIPAYGPLSEQKIAIHVVSPQSGQLCSMLSEKTDSSGYIQAECQSSTAGTISVYFSAPELDQQTNQSIKAVPKPVVFDTNPNAPAINTVTIAPSVEEAGKSASTNTTKADDSTQSKEETEKLQKRLNALEKTVQEQKKEVSGLRLVVNNLLDFIRKFFGK